jgi:hypothetical protein
MKSSHRKGRRKASIDWTLTKPPHDVHLVAIASGPGVSSPYWPIPSPYQPVNRTRWPRVFGATNPIWIDADGDGVFTTARGYAETLVQRVGTSADKLIPSLSGYDESVAAQAAALSQAAGEDLRSAIFGAALDSASEPVQRGFAAFLRTLPENARQR